MIENENDMSPKHGWHQTEHERKCKEHEWKCNQSHETIQRTSSLEDSEWSRMVHSETLRFSKTKFEQILCFPLITDVH